MRLCVCIIITVIALLARGDDSSSTPFCAEYKDKTKTFNSLQEMFSHNSIHRSEFKFVEQGDCSQLGKHKYICPDKCSMKEKQVCAYSNIFKQKKEFENECIMNHFNCKNKMDYTVRFHKTNNNPVCACPKTDAKDDAYLSRCHTFSETCQVTPQLEIVHEGFCTYDDTRQVLIKLKNKDCGPKCKPKENEAVCSCSGHTCTTYQDKCILQQQNCLNNYKYKVTANGTCTHTIKRQYFKKLTGLDCGPECPTVDKTVCACKDGVCMNYKECRLIQDICFNVIPRQKIIHEGKCGSVVPKKSGMTTESATVVETTKKH